MCYPKVAAMEGGTKFEALDHFVGVIVLHVAVLSGDQITLDRIKDMDYGVPVACWGCVGNGSKFKWTQVEK